MSTTTNQQPAGGTTEPSAASQVFALPELKEMILLQMDPEDLLSHLHADADLYTTVKNSPALRQKLFLTQKPAVQVQPDPDRFPMDNIVGTHNTILLPQPDSSFRFRTHANGAIYQLERRGNPAFDGIAYELSMKTNNQDQSAPILAPAYFSMFLADHNIPVTVDSYLRPTENFIGGARDPNSTERNDFHGDPLRSLYMLRELYLSPGTTLGDLIQWMELFYTGKVKTSDIVNGICQYQTSFIRGQEGAEEKWDEEYEEEFEYELECEKGWRLQGYWVVRIDGVWLKPLRK